MKVYFDTLGCMKNFDDSDMAMGILENSGHKPVTDPEEADCIIVNTCGFIEDAKRESIDEILDMAGYREKGKKLIVSGCLAKRYAMELSKELSEVDGFIGVNEYDRLPELLDRLSNGERFVEAGEYDPERKSDVSLGNRPRYVPEGVYSTYLRISEGCDRKCSYCIIPKIRGPYRSKPVENLVKEASMLASKGCKELVIIAEDTGRYGVDLYGEKRLAELLRKLSEIDGIRWIRLMYCYEDGITEELIDEMASNDKILDYIDIPLQHASDSVLKRMRRNTTNAEIREKINLLRERIPDITIRTTFITGFPGETESDMDELLSLVDDVRFERLGVFTFSPEEGTEAYDMPDQIDQEVKEERRDAVMMRQMDISLSHNREMTGKTFDVIIDSCEDDGTYIGRTKKDAPEMDDSVVFTSDHERHPGDIVKVMIDDAFDYDVTGREVNDESTE